MEELTRDELKAIIQKQNEKIAELTAKVSELEARLNMNSSNSSKPPSSEGLAKPAVKSLRGKSGKNPGGQKGHKGHGLRIESEPDEVVEVEPEECPNCGSDLTDVEGVRADTKYVYDVEINVKLTKYEIYQVVCPQCDSVVIGRLPEEYKGTVNYGNMIRTLAVVLTQYANVGIDKTHKILRDLLGVPICGGTIKNIQRQFATKTGDIITEIKENLRNSPTIHADETGARVNGRTQWFHVASNSKYTLVTAHRNRGRVGSESGGVLAEYTGTLVHDCWTPYFGFDKCKHALCCAHLLRELIALIEQGLGWADSMVSLLLEMKDVVDRYKNDDKTELSRYYRTKFESRYDAILEQAKMEIVPSATRKKTKAENLLIRLEKYRTEITRFTDDFDVPFDNNQAERDVRIVKVKQKVTGGFRTDEGAEDFANTSSVIGTVVKFGQSVVATVNDLFADRKLQLLNTTE